MAILPKEQFLLSAIPKWEVVFVHVKILTPSIWSLFRAYLELVIQLEDDLLRHQMLKFNENAEY